MIINGKIITNEADIEKSKVVISEHAIERFLQRSKENHPKVPVPKNHYQAKEWLTNLFLGSYHKNAIDPVSRTKCLIDHGESFFFRNDRWQFVVRGNNRYPNNLVMTTVVFYSDRQLSFLSH